MPTRGWFSATAAMGISMPARAIFWSRACGLKRSLPLRRVRAIFRRRGSAGTFGPKSTFSIFATPVRPLRSSCATGPGSGSPRGAPPMGASWSSAPTLPSCGGVNPNCAASARSCVTRTCCWMPPWTTWFRALPCMTSISA
ncbi:unnamed protein product [Ectocarpus fasciculatus]